MKWRSGKARGDDESPALSGCALAMQSRETALQQLGRALMFGL